MGQFMDITIHGNTAELVQEKMFKGGYQSPDDVVYKVVELLIKQKINNSIQCGLNDIDTGNFQKLTGNIDKIADSIINQARQKQ
jgi:hypothetical protein